MKRPNDHEDLFLTPVVVPTDLGFFDDHEGTSGCQESVGGLLCFFDSHRVKDVRHRNGDECANAFDECGVGESAIEDVRCAEGKEQGFVVKRGGRDDGRETGQFGELDRCEHKKRGQIVSVCRCDIGSQEAYLVGRERMRHRI
jgi:hypothetical protein